VVQLGVTEHTGPFCEAQVGGDDHAGFFIQLAEQMKQQGTASLTERQIPQFIKDYQIGMYEVVGQSSLPAVELFLFQCVHQFNFPPRLATIPYATQGPNRHAYSRL